VFDKKNICICFPISPNNLFKDFLTKFCNFHFLNVYSRLGRQRVSADASADEHLTKSCANGYRMEADAKGAQGKIDIKKIIRLKQTRDDLSQR